MPGRESTQHVCRALLEFTQDAVATYPGLGIEVWMLPGVGPVPAIAQLTVSQWLRLAANIWVADLPELSLVRSHAGMKVLLQAWQMADDNASALAGTALIRVTT